jgi:hypothetical protein
MRNRLTIVILAAIALLLTAPCLRAQQAASAVCTVQATVLPAITLRTITNLESASSHSSVLRTEVSLSGEGVIRLKVESTEQSHEVTIDLQRESKELKDKTFSRINKIKVEYLSS